MVRLHGLGYSGSLDITLHDYSESRFVLNKRTYERPQGPIFKYNIASQPIGNPR